MFFILFVLIQFFTVFVYFMSVFCSFLFLVIFIQFGHFFSFQNLSRFIALSFIFGDSVFLSFVTLFFFSFLFFEIFNLESIFTHSIDKLQIQEKNYCTLNENTKQHRVQPARNLHFTTGFPRTEPGQP